MNLAFGDLRALPENSLPRFHEEMETSHESYQCVSSFLVNEKKLIVSLEG